MGLSSACVSIYKDKPFVIMRLLKCLFEYIFNDGFCDYFESLSGLWRKNLIKFIYLFFHIDLHLNLFSIDSFDSVILRMFFGSKFDIDLDIRCYTLSLSERLVLLLGWGE